MGVVLEVLGASVRLKDAADVAQIVLAGAAVLALIGAAIQIRVQRSIAKRQLAYEYLGRFSSRDVLELSSEFRVFWKAKTYTDFDVLGPEERSQMLVVPNLIEELGSLYNRRRLDRDVVALALGVLVELLWEEGQALIRGGKADRGEWVYCEWAEMQADTRLRRDRAHDKIRRRRAWKTLLFGNGA